MTTNELTKVWNKIKTLFATKNELPCEIAVKYQNDMYVASHTGAQIKNMVENGIVPYVKIYGGDWNNMSLNFVGMNNEMAMFSNVYNGIFLNTDIAEIVTIWSSSVQNILDSAKSLHIIAAYNEEQGVYLTDHTAKEIRNAKGRDSSRHFILDIEGGEYDGLRLYLGYVITNPNISGNYLAYFSNYVNGIGFDAVIDDNQIMHLEANQYREGMIELFSFISGNNEPEPEG